MSAGLSHVFWLGGSPCSGKSSIADRLEAELIYRCDDAYCRHQTLVTPEAQPTFSRLTQASCDDIWMRPIERQGWEYLALYREEFPVILADLATLPDTQPVIAERGALLPELLAAIGVEVGRAAWVLPSEEFQRRCYERREWRHDVLRTCADPDQAWQNRMARDGL